MDRRAFDDFTRQLAAAQSRRRALGALLGTVLSGILARDPAAAQEDALEDAALCSLLGQPCHRDAHCCTGHCYKGFVCRRGERKESGKGKRHKKRRDGGDGKDRRKRKKEKDKGKGTDKRCRTREKRCGDKCINPRTNRSHCGGCNRACPPGEICVAGACAIDCPAELRLCGEECVDLQTDPEHCGDCQTACLAEQDCVAGSCACPEGQQVCGDECVDVQTDPDHCGNCDVVCADEQTCVGGGCQCPAGEELCGEQCVNTQSDPQHCGNCETMCESGQECVASVCTCTAQSCNGCCVGESCLAEGAACNGSETCCDEQCVNTRTDPANCDTCGNICPAPDNGSATCANGQCGFTCDPGFHDCDGACVSNDSVATCGNRCAPCPAPANATATCTGGQCGFVCDGGFVECNGACFSPCANPTQICNVERPVCAEEDGLFCNCFNTGCGPLCVQAEALCVDSCADCPTGLTCIDVPDPQVCLPGCEPPRVFCSPPCRLL